MTESSQGGFVEEMPGKINERREPLGRDAGSIQVMGGYVEGLTGGNRAEPSGRGNPGLEGNRHAICRADRSRDPGQQTSSDSETTTSSCLPFQALP